MAGNNRTVHIVRGYGETQNNYTSLQKNPLRRDWDRNVAYTNEVERMMCKGIQIMQTQFVDPACNVNNPLHAFISVETRPIDPKIGWSLSMVGYTLPYEEHGVDVGDHLVARVHAEIPEIVMNTYNFFSIRNTYSTRREWKLLELPSDEVDEFYARQLAAFTRSSENGLRFLGYMIFADMNKEIQQNSNENKDKYPYEIDESIKDYHFEEFKKTMFCPPMENGKLIDIPGCGCNLALELVPVINPEYKVTNNACLNATEAIRKKLKTHKSKGKISKLRFQHDIPDPAKEIVVFKECCQDAIYDMLGNAIKYRIELPNVEKKGFTLCISPSDLIMIMNDRDEERLNEVVPNLIKADRGGFSESTMRVGRIIRTRGMPSKEALILHKDALKLIITKNNVDSETYKEHGVTNRWHSLGYYLDVFGMFPACYICKDTDQN